MVMFWSHNCGTQGVSIGGLLIQIGNSPLMLRILVAALPGIAV
jgi:hypothetical protein